MKKFNKSKVIIPALAMIALTTAASATGTVAWFAANTTVNVTGMTMTATAGSNLLIATDSIKNTTKIAANSTAWGNSLTQSDASNIAPVSTINGTAFYYTNDAIANGDAQSNATFTALDVTTSSTSYRKIATSTYGFLEYVFQLQATNSDTTNNKYIDLTTLSLSYTAANADLNAKASAIHAYRAAVFVEDISSASDATAGVGTLNAIYAQTGYSHFTSGEAVSAAAGTTSAVTYATAETYSSLATVPAGKTTQYKVVVRAYLEGEDVTCYNDGFIGITSGWSLAVGLTLNSIAKTNAVSAITTTVTTSA